MLDFTVLYIWTIVFSWFGLAVLLLGANDVLKWLFPAWASSKYGSAIHKYRWRIGAVLLVLAQGTAYRDLSDRLQKAEKDVDSKAARIQIFEAEKSHEPRLNGLAAVESENSLRRRTIRLADNIEEFWMQRQSFPPNPGYADKVIAERYAQESERLCLQRFREQIIGIPKELRLKGLDVGWLDSIDPVRCLNPPDGFGGGDTPRLRNLAHWLDANDQVERF